MTISDDVKELEDSYNYAKERICELLDEKIEYGETIRQLTIELNDKKKECNTLAESKKKLESMLDLCESSCSTCKKHIEVENLKNRIKNLESKLTDREKVIEIGNNRFNAALSSIRQLQEGKTYWHDRYTAHIAYCLGKCPRVEPKQGV